jgi:hypothetical protein
MRWRIAGVVAAVAVVAVAVAIAAGTWRWRTGTAALAARLLDGQASGTSSIYDERELTDLPDVVARYFRTVLRDRQPIIRGVRATQKGEFRSEDAEHAWRRFTAVQTFGTRPPGFVWDARIDMGAGVAVLVRDAYSGRRASMQASVLGLVPVVDVSGTPELASGALQRYLAEAAWFPTALLPSQGVRWTPLDPTTARATLTDGPTVVSLDFRFGPEGEIVEVSTRSRYREDRGRYVPTPWGGRFGPAEPRGGVRVPMSAEVAWEIDGRRFPYWRGRITSIQFE